MKGIRSFVNEKFAEHLPQLTELGNVGFRKAVMGAAVSQFGISVASAATHYNHALKTVKAMDAELVAGLGRSDDKKGGRPVLHPVTVVKAKSGEVVVDGISRAKAETLILTALGKGKPKLVIKQDVDAAAAAEAEAAVAAATPVAAAETVSA